MNYIILSFYVLISLISFYSVGSVLMWLFKIAPLKETYFDTFIRSLLGVLTLVFFFAAIKTNGNTIHLGFFILGALYLFYRKRNANYADRGELLNIFHFRKNARSLLLLLVLGLAFFLIYACFYFEKPFDNIFHFDEVFYSFLSSKLGLYGIESSSTIHELNYAASPYHYTELWLSNLLSWGFNINPLLTFSLIIRTVLTSLLSISMLSLAKQFTSNKIIGVLAVFSIFIAPIMLDYSHVIQRASNAYHVKSIFAALFYVWFSILVLNRSNFWFFPLLLLPVINIAYTPVVFTTLSFYAIIIWIRKKSLRAFLNMYVPVFIMSIFIAGFYFLQPHTKDSEALFSFKDIVSYYDLKFLVIDTIKHVKNYLMYSMYFLPFLILIIYLFLKDKLRYKFIIFRVYPLFIYLVIAMIIGNIMQFLFYPFAGANAGQLNGINYVPLMNIIAFISLLIVFKEIQKRKKMLRRTLIFFVLFLFTYNLAVFFLTIKNSIDNPINKRSSKYITEVINYFKTKKVGYLGGFIMPFNELDNNGHDFKDFSQTGGELSSGYWLTPYSTLVDFLYVINIPINNYVDFKDVDFEINNYEDRDKSFFRKKAKIEILNSPFYVFSRDFQKRNGKVSLDILQYEFIKKYKIEYLTVSEGVVIPDIFSSTIDTIFIDEMTGERFIFLKD